MKAYGHAAAPSWKRAVSASSKWTLLPQSYREPQGCDIEQFKEHRERDVPFDAVCWLLGALQSAGLRGASGGASGVWAGPGPKCRYCAVLFTLNVHTTSECERKSC